MRARCLWVVVLQCVLILDVLFDGATGRFQASLTDNTVCSKPKYIRVLLEEQDATGETNFTLKAKDGFVLESPVGSGVTALVSHPALEIRVARNKIYLKCKEGGYRPLKHNDVEICSSSEKIKVNKAGYHGTFRLRIDPKSKRLQLINKLDLEDYVYAVLRCESVPSWPHEMQKVQAIASRTYALYHMKLMRTRNPHSPYDIKNTTINQLYNGTHGLTYLRDAVDDTKNLILTYRGDVALTMFDICCGGIIPGFLRNRDVSKPYLCRMTPCVYCKNAGDYRWNERVSKQYLLDRLKSNTKIKSKLGALGAKLHDISIVDKDRAGVVRKIRLSGRSYVTLTGNDIRSSLGGKIKSVAFSIKKDKNYYTFMGHGNSHFHGLCQWGAKELIERGWSYRRVLDFYYPGTIINRLI
jgi:stage II sporulation protein D